MFNSTSPNWRKLVQSLVLASITVGVGVSSGALNAAQLKDGRTTFDIAPRLEQFTTLRPDTGDRRAIYYITVDVPATAGESLKTLTVTLVQGRFFPRLRYRLDQLEVFQGDRRNRGTVVPIASAEYDEDAQTLTIDLAEAVAPGQTITFALKPVRNPSRQGVYLFEIGAVPAGEQPIARRIGIGRLNIFGDADPK